MAQRDFLESYIASLDDERFFFIAHNVLGKFPTPFHKPQLASRIVTFMTNEDVMHNTMKLLSPTDIAFLTYLELSGGATEKQIASFFPDIPFSSVICELENLSDRLLILQISGSNILNPVFSEVFNNEAVDLSLLFETSEIQEDACQTADSNIVRACLNFLINGSVPARNANMHHFLKSGKLEQALTGFSDPGQAFLTIRELSLETGAVRSDGSSYRLDRAKATWLLALEPVDLAVLACAGQDESLKQSLETALSVLAGTAVQKKEFSRLLCLKNRFEEETVSSVLSKLISLGIVCEKDGKLYLNPTAIHYEKQSRSALRADSNLVVSYFGTPEPDDILYLFADIISCDSMTTYCITRESFFRALEMGLSPQEIVQHIGFEDINDTLRFWKQEFDRIHLYEGSTICCSAQLGKVLEEIDALRSFILAHPCQEVFILDSSQKDSWMPILHNATDLQKIPQPSRPEMRSASAFGFQNVKTRVVPIESRTADPGQRTGLQKDLVEDAKSKQCYTRQLQSLIDSRLIVSKSQIGPSFSYGEEKSISGFDFNAKLTFLKECIKSRSRLISVETVDSTFIARPLEILKSEQGPVVRLSILPEYTEKTLSVGALFKITALRQGIEI